jgi:hypothetical protein
VVDVYHEPLLERLDDRKRLRIVCIFSLYPHCKIGLDLFVSSDKPNRTHLVAPDVSFPVIDSIHVVEYGPARAYRPIVVFANSPTRAAS